jgi:uncharacterized protein (DUF111 family)
MAGGFETDEVYQLETNLDDCSGEVLGATMERLLAAGALDVWFTPVFMKKHRPGVALGVICEEGVRDALADIILTETTAFGLRVQKIHRLKLARRFKLVETPYGEVQIKLGLKGGRVVQVTPEFDSVRAASEASGIPIRIIHEAAVKAWRDRSAGEGPDELA